MFGDEGVGAPEGAPVLVRLWKPLGLDVSLR